MESPPPPEITTKKGKKRKAQDEGEYKVEKVPRLPQTFTEKASAKRLVVVLEGANLETVKNGNEYQLLNSEDHIKILKKKQRDPNQARPDITHQVSNIISDIYHSLCLWNLLISITSASSHYWIVL